jgi:hypothetical protein
MWEGKFVVFTWKYYYVARKLMSSSLLKRTQVYFIVWNGEDPSTKDMRDDCREMEATNK